MRGEQSHPGRVGGIRHALRLGGAHLRQRLLAHHMPPAGDGAQGEVGVRRGGREDPDHIDPVEESVHIVFDLHAELRGQRHGAGARGEHALRTERLPGVQMGRGDPARADQADAQRCVVIGHGVSWPLPDDRSGRCEVRAPGETFA